MPLFDRLREAAAKPWRDYCHHPFVAGLADGSLPEAAFRHYLVQDYLFLIQFARAYALAAFKSDTLEDMRAAAATMSALVDTEMRMHVEYCAGWGLDEAAMAAAPEAMETTAYTRFVLDCGQRGDLLDLLVALAPCVVGYGEIGARLDADAATRREGNPYLPWIEMYAGTEYQEVATAACDQLDRLGGARGGEARFDALAKTFDQATRLEIGFWEMGWRAGAP
ncbi:MAG: thiaminase II [Alphaproteobacteria bacterium]|jgi:thiaminase/transcriptional activator TenA|nr:thiaminase II [Alphaproteobacteria bacterium]